MARPPRETEEKPRLAADEGARDDLEFVRAMRELEVRPARPKRGAARARPAEPSVVRARLEEEDALFEAHMKRLFAEDGAAEEDAAGAPPAGAAARPAEPADADADAAAAEARTAAEARAAAERARQAEEDALFARYMETIDETIDETVDAGTAPVPGRRPAAPPAPEPDAAVAAAPDAAPDAEPEDDDGRSLLHGSLRALERRLRKGEIAPTAEVDLHRLRKDEAVNRLDSFLRQSARSGHELVLVITGRGLHSVDLGVLRELIPVLLRRRWPDVVRECLPAPRHLGGEGAFVAFLRAQRKP